MAIGLYGGAMHAFVLDELETGTRAAMARDAEAVGLGPLFDLRVVRDPATNPHVRAHHWFEHDEICLDCGLDRDQMLADVREHGYPTCEAGAACA